MTKEITDSSPPNNVYPLINLNLNHTYCFDALMKDRFMNKIKLSKFSNEFDVPQHLDLSNGSLFLLLGEEGIFTLIIDWKKENKANQSELS